MDHEVRAEVAALLEAAAAHVADVGTVAVVRAEVVVQVQPAHEHLAALVTRVQTAALVHLTAADGTVTV